MRIYRRKNVHIRKLSSVYAHFCLPYIHMHIRNLSSVNAHLAFCICAYTEALFRICKRCISDIFIFYISSSLTDGPSYTFKRAPSPLNAPNFHFVIRYASLTSPTFILLLSMDHTICLKGKQKNWGLQQQSFSLDRWREINLSGCKFVIEVIF